MLPMGWVGRWLVFFVSLLVTRLAAIGMAFTMLVAAYMHGVVLGQPFVAKGGPSYELALVFFAVAFLFVMAGPGNYSLDSKIFGKKAG